MKRIISLIVTVLLLINIMPFAALAANGDARDNTQDATINFKISEATVHPGYTDEIVVYVDIANNPGFAGAELTIKYDTAKLTLISAAKCDPFSQAFTLTVNKESGFVMLENTVNVKGNGSLLQLTFGLKTSENNPVQEYDCEIDLVVAELFDENLDDIGSSIDTGKISVKHDWTAETCTAPKTCKTCGATDGEAPGHTEGEAVKENEQPATANTPGSYDEVVYCTVCGEELSRKNVTVEQLAGVAKVGETSYDVLADALAAAQSDETKTAVLLTDVEEAILMIPAGVTLDLNGKTITASVAVLAYGDIVDTAAVAGGIKIGTDKIVHLQANNTYMPLYDTTTGCYKFFDYEIEALSKNGTADSINLGVRVLFDNREAYEVLAQGTTNTSVTLSLTWDGRSASPVQYTITEETVKAYATKAYTQSATGSVGTAISVNVNGLGSIAGKTLSATAKFTSTTNVASVAPFDPYAVPSTNSGTETE